MKDLKNKSSSPQLGCHPHALPAFEFTLLIFRLKSKRIPSRHRLAFLTRTAKLSTTLIGDSEYFFDGWLPLLCSNVNVRKKCYHKGVPTIETQSWSYALQAVFFLSSKNTLIRNLALFFEHAPIKFQARLFDCKLPATVLARTVEFTAESRSAVRHALKNEVPNA